MNISFFNRVLQKVQTDIFYLILLRRSIKILDLPNREQNIEERFEKVGFTIATIPTLHTICTYLNTLTEGNPSWVCRIILFDLHQSADSIKQVEYFSQTYEIIPVYKLLLDCNLNIIDLLMHYDLTIIHRVVIPFYMDILFRKGTNKVLYINGISDTEEHGDLDEIFDKCSSGYVLNNYGIFNWIPDGNTSAYFIGLNRNCESILLLNLWMSQIRIHLLSNTSLMKDMIGLKTGIRLIPRFIRIITITGCQKWAVLLLLNLIKKACLWFQDETSGLIRKCIFQKPSETVQEKPGQSPVPYQIQTPPSAFTRIPLYNICIDPVIQRLFNRIHIPDVRDINIEEKILQLIRIANKEILKTPPLSQYWYEVYLSNEDLQNQYPDITRNINSRCKYLSWIDQYGPSQYESSKIVADKKKGELNVPFGITISGYFLNVFGIAEIGRAFASALLTTHIPVSLHPLISTHHGTFNNPDLNRYWIDNYFFSKKSYRINIFMVNADLIPGTIQAFDQDFFSGKYIIGCWFWEIEDFFPFEEAINYVNEIWGFSDFCCNTFRKFSSKPVHKITYPFYETWNKISDTRDVRRSLGIDPDVITFFFNFDFHSCFERKNPLGTIKAFSKAFCKGTEKVALIIKTIHAERYITYAKQLHMAVHTDRRIIWINQSMTKNEFISVLNASDCYISLHRSEGLGIGMIEAMYLGKCVIATGYGGNLDFMDNTNSFLINYSPVEIQNDFGPYKKGCRWADPSLDQTVQILKHVYSNYEEFSQKYGKKASADIREKYNPKKTTEDILQRIYEINSYR